MAFVARAADRRLAAFVESLWLQEEPAADAELEPTVLLPVGRAALVVEYGDPFEELDARGVPARLPPALLAGQRTGPARVAAGARLVAGLQRTPGVAGFLDRGRRPAAHAYRPGTPRPCRAPAAALPSGPAMLACCFLAGMVPQVSPAVEYTVTPSGLERAHVVARFAAAPAAVSMATGGTGSALGFAEFVRDLHAVGEGRPVALARDGARWVVPAGTAGELVLEYDVVFPFAGERWPAGNEQAGFTDGRALFLSAKALFVDGDASGAREVRFALPDGFAVATAWEPLGGGAAFRCAGSADLLENTLVLGRFAPSVADAGRFRFTLVALGDFGDAQARVHATLASVASEFTRLFPETPATSYLVTLLPGAADDGEAYRGSFAATLEPPLEAESRIAWANTLAHELFHFWCGHALAAERPAMEWLTEGFTEYYAGLALVRTGGFTPDEFLRKVEHALGQYEYFLSSPLYGETTLLQAGQRKSANRFGVYGGGWALALGLDDQLRRHSGEERSLDDLMALLYRELGHTGEPLTFEALLEIVAAEAGAEARAWLETHAATRTPIELAPLLRAYGLAMRSQPYDGELHAWIERDASPGATQRRRAWAGF